MTLTVYTNSHTDREAALAAAAELLTADEREHAWKTITAWPEYRRTPFVERPDLAERARVGRVFVKDESLRSHLRSFKSLGGAYAVQRAHQRWQEAGKQGPFVVSCVTDGNHGLSVAWGAKALGVECIIYVPTVVSDERAEKIAEQGATVHRIDGNYDEVTRLHASHAAHEGWTIVTDTEGRQDETNQSVIDVMQGYGVLARELGDDFATIAPPTHVFMQAGCGGMAAAILPDMMRAAPSADFLVIEPERAACLQASAREGEAKVIEGDLATRMVGMSAGEVSQPAWRINYPAVAGYAAIGDELVNEAMRSLSIPTGGAQPVESGETGCAGLAALLELERDKQARATLDVDENSIVVLINTEGATDPESYERIVGKPAAPWGVPVG